MPRATAGTVHPPGPGRSSRANLSAVRTGDQTGLKRVPSGAKLFGECGESHRVTASCIVEALHAAEQQLGDLHRKLSQGTYYAVSESSMRLAV